MLTQLLEGLAHVSNVIQVWGFVEKRVPPLAALPSLALQVAIGGVTVAITLALMAWYLRRQRKRFMLPDPWEPPAGRFAGDRQLTFSCVREPEGIVALAATDTYGDRGTDVEQVTAWWMAYPQGNVLALNGGRVVGGATSVRSSGAPSRRRRPARWTRRR